MKKDLIKDNLESVKEILENIHGDDVLIMIASVNGDGNPVLDTIEGKPNMSKDTAYTLFSVALAAIEDESGAEGEVTEGYVLKPAIPMAKTVQ